MPKLLQINVVNNMLSTGKICEDIAKVAGAHGWECYVAYGRKSRPSVSDVIHVGTRLNTYAHYLEFRLLDDEGLGSRMSTRLLVRKIKQLKPDIIHLHNIHDHYLNYRILFEYLSHTGIPVVWTQHDCWSFTGGCMYFDMLGCDIWRTGQCEKCPDNRALINMAERNFRIKKDMISSLKSLTFVPVSDWLHELLKQSVHGSRDIVTIHNGIDIKRFRPSEEDAIKNTREKFSILGVAAVWDARKGLEDFKKLRTLLPDEYEISLVGLSESQINSLPDGIKGIKRTQNVDEMVRLYSSSNVFVNPTYSDNFPTVNVEALACGTPVITYRTGGSPEAIDAFTGAVVERGNVEDLARCIMSLRQNPLEPAACRARAERLFDKDACFEAYLGIYNSLLR